MGCSVKLFMHLLVEGGGMRGGHAAVFVRYMRDETFPEAPFLL